MPYSSIAVWAVVKKKPLVRELHDTARDQEGEGEEVGSGWVTSVAAFPNSDLVASGLYETKDTWDGSVCP